MTPRGRRRGREISEGSTGVVSPGAGGEPCCEPAALLTVASAPGDGSMQARSSVNPFYTNIRVQPLGLKNRGTGETVGHDRDTEVGVFLFL